ncbi:hypothetical protein [Burkholderia ubonensis]|nr:hypothetical protein [Burkholderia ubonensis]
MDRYDGVVLAVMRLQFRQRILEAGDAVQGINFALRCVAKVNVD